jgi:hypothetical protein
MNKQVLGCSACHTALTSIQMLKLKKKHTQKTEHKQNNQIRTVYQYRRDEQRVTSHFTNPVIEAPP